MPPAVPSQTILGRKDEFSLEDAYLAFDLRESYLQRKSNSFAAEAESIYLATEDFETKTDSMFRADDISLYPQPSEIEGSQTLVSNKEKVSNHLITRKFITNNC